MIIINEIMIMIENDNDEIMNKMIMNKMIMK